MGITGYGSGHDDVSSVREGDMVMVGGTIRAAGTNTLVGTLPKDRRPADRLVFNAHAGSVSTRVDVFPNGRIVWVNRKLHPSNDYLFLNGINFEVGKAGTALQLTNGWWNFGKDSAPATATKVGNRVIVSGLIKGRSWGHLATLPAGMCPAKKASYALNNDVNTARVDVTPDCKITWISGDKSPNWISLNGISFYTS
ncbi:MAG: hypothetical protein VW405_17940 [Rhodospirillaceae bacterium]